MSISLETGPPSEGGLEAGLQVPKPLLLALLSWGSGSLTMWWWEKWPVPLMLSRARQGACELGLNPWVSFPLVDPGAFGEGR